MGLLRRRRRAFAEMIGSTDCKRPERLRFFGFGHRIGLRSDQSDLPAWVAERLSRSLLEARVIIQDWRLDYNAERPHTAHGDLTPAEFDLRWKQINQPTAA